MNAGSFQLLNRCFENFCKVSNLLLVHWRSTSKPSNTFQHIYLEGFEVFKVSLLLTILFRVTSFLSIYFTLLEKVGHLQLSQKNPLCNQTNAANDLFKKCVILSFTQSIEDKSQCSVVSPDIFICLPEIQIYP